MLETIVKQSSKPTEKNFRFLAALAYNLSNLEFYNSYCLNYYSSKDKNKFFTQFWILRNEVKQLIK